MSVYDNIIKILKDKNISYSEFHHKPLISAKESTAARLGEQKESVKSLLFKTGKGDFILVLMSGDKRVDAKVIKRLEGTDNLALASADEVEKASGVPVGAVAPFGIRSKLKTYFYKGILENEYSWFAAGNLTISIKVKSKNLLKLVENPVLFEQ